MVAKDILQKLPQFPGVYLFISRSGEVLYIGKALDLRRRVSSYFRPRLSLGEKTRRLVRAAEKVRHVRVESEIEALILEAELIRKHHPRYNSQWKDDKHYLYIQIARYWTVKRRKKSRVLKKIQPAPDGVGASVLSSERVDYRDFPTITASRQANDPDSLYFGPFPQGRTIKEVLKYLRRVFGYCSWSKTKYLRLGGTGHGCFHYQIGLCPGPCAGAVSKQEYFSRINQIVLFLRGKKRIVIQELQRQMQAAITAQEFEKAAQVRDQLRQLEYVTQDFRQAEDYVKNPNLVEDLRAEEIQGLIEVLSLPAGTAAAAEKNRVFKKFSAPGSRQSAAAGFRIEAYDISNLQGKSPAASRVVFVGGEPDKSLYRRYRIKAPEKPNDYLMMKEVLQRRSKRADQDNWPDLILVDGGKGQVGVALQLLRELRLDIPVIGLTKRREEVILPTQRLDDCMTRFRSVRLSTTSPALKLLQRIRDEAHRFALAYHRDLRRQLLTGIR